jgi:hypothetical protein
MDDLARRGVMIKDIYWTMGRAATAAPPSSIPPASARGAHQRLNDDASRNASALARASHLP